MTSYPDACVRQLQTLEATIKKQQQRMKELKEKKTELRGRLNTWMEKHNVDEYEGYKLEKSEPKVKKPRVTKKRKKANVMKLCRDTGIPDPEDFWQRLEDIQTGKVEGS